MSFTGQRRRIGFIVYSLLSPSFLVRSGWIIEFSPQPLQALVDVFWTEVVFNGGKRGCFKAAIVAAVLIYAAPLVAFTMQTMIFKDFVVSWQYGVAHDTWNGGFTFMFLTYVLQKLTKFADHR